LGGAGPALGLDTEGFLSLSSFVDGGGDGDTMEADRTGGRGPRTDELADDMETDLSKFWGDSSIFTFLLVSRLCGG
jgi:hypothetical protein